MYLVFVKLSILQLSLSLLLEGDDDQSNEDVNEEERENNEVDDVEYGHFDCDLWLWPMVLKGGSHGILEHSVKRVENIDCICHA